MSDPESQFDLCDRRLQFLDNYDNHILVEGGPGAGKTTLALLKARRAVIERIDDSQSVLFLSFSNAAIRQIADKASTLLDKEISTRIEIKTYHSFAWGILRSHGYLLSNKRQLQILASHDQAVYKAGYSDESWAQKEQDLFRCSGIVSFDRFAPSAANLVQVCRKIRNLYSSKYPLILVDEFQDTDKYQWKLLILLAEQSQLIAFGDEKQLIHNWRKNVHIERLNEFKNMTNAIQYDFGHQNYRNSETGIEHFAKTLLHPGQQIFKCSAIRLISYDAGKFNSCIKSNVMDAYKELKSINHDGSISVVIAGRNKNIVRRISNLLSESQAANGNPLEPIHHEVLFDHEKLHLATRVVAFLIEGRQPNEYERLAKVLDLLADFHISGGKRTHIETAHRIRRWAKLARSGKPKRVKLVKSIRELICQLNSKEQTGSPVKDWLQIRDRIAESNDKKLSDIAKDLKFLRLLNRGSEIEAKLSELWRQQGNYCGAMQVMENTILDEQVLDKYRKPATFTVMTMHQLKGKEFDAVVLVEDWLHQFSARDDSINKMNTRRLLYMAITRARKFAIILSQRGKSTIDNLSN